MLNIYFCMDDRMGLMFNRRRQSRDEKLLEDLRTSVSGPVWVRAYSRDLLEQAGIPCRLLEDTSVEAIEGDYFAEGHPQPELLERADRLVVYRWNRHYPADERWTAPFPPEGFVLTETAEFPGKSHERITREVYVK